jgi:hypothetical protein
MYQKHGFVLVMFQPFEDNSIIFVVALAKHWFVLCDLIGVCTLKWLNFCKKYEHKSPFYNVKFLNFFGIMGSMVIKSILIGAHLCIPNICTSKKRNLKFEKIQLC